MGSIRRRLRVLEGRVQPELADRSEVRQKMKENLLQIARLRRGELSPEEAAEVEAFRVALERERARRRGEGTS